MKYVEGWATFRDGKTVSVATETGEQLIKAETVVIATGSAPVELPFLPFGGPVISSTEALSPKKLPKSLAIVGAGYIGLELGTVYRKLGVKVDVIEAQDRILPVYDADLVKPVHAALKALGVGLHLQTQVLGLTEDGKGLRVQSGKTEDVLPA